MSVLLTSPCFHSTPHLPWRFVRLLNLEVVSSELEDYTGLITWIEVVLIRQASVCGSSAFHLEFQAFIGVAEMEVDEAFIRIHGIIGQSHAHAAAVHCRVGVGDVRCENDDVGDGPRQVFNGADRRGTRSGRCVDEAAEGC